MYILSIMSMSAPEQKALVTFKKAGGILRTSEALELGIHRRTLYGLRDRGLLERVSRGVHRLADLAPLGDPDLVRVALRVPRAVICLISALDFHGLTAEIPHEVQIALPRGTKEPKVKQPPIRVFRFSDAAYREGIETHSVDGVDVRIYGPAKTIADCFKFRNKIGLDVALEALRTGVEEQRFRPAELMKVAQICRVQEIVRPYLEILV
jgi:predicted transcriptional regulator of viral defense system